MSVWEHKSTQFYAFSYRSNCNFFKKSFHSLLYTPSDINDTKGNMNEHKENRLFSFQNPIDLFKKSIGFQLKFIGKHMKS